MKHFATLVVMTFGFTTANAQMPVIDVASFTQAVSQVKAWKAQYEQMSQQFKQLEAQRAAMTGVRHLGDILNDPALRSVAPADVAKIFDAIQGNGSAGLTPSARALRNASKLYDCEDRRGADKSTCQALLSTNAQAQAYEQNAMVLLNQRAIQIQSLQSRINTTTDMKSIGELQARLQAEASQVNNDTNRIAIMRAMSDSADRAARQAIKERQLRNLSLTTDGSDTFVYKPHFAKP